MKAMILATTLLLTACGTAAGDDGKRVFEGEYQWSQGGDDVLTAELTPRPEDDGWKVKFRFEFNGRSHTWKGTARGPLTEGSELTGTAEGLGDRTWEFRATLRDGVLAGRHVETTDGERVDTGAFVLTAVTDDVS